MTRRNRIVAVCLHPAIDRTVEAPRLTPGGVVRAKALMVEAAGKGLNVARSAAATGAEVLACGFVGRQDASFFKRTLDASGVTQRFTKVACETRQNLTLVDKATGEDTHVIADPMTVTRDEVAALLHRLDKSLRRNDRVVVTGSAPKGFRPADLRHALSICAERGALPCVDSSGRMLKAAIRAGVKSDCGTDIRVCAPWPTGGASSRHRVWLIKPNREELAELSGRALPDIDSVVDAARGLLNRCAQVLVSLGAEGAILARPDGCWHARERHRAKTVHTVGCGDALLAGFLSTTLDNGSPADALRFAVACGSACVRSRSAAVASRTEVERIAKRIALKAL